MAAANDDNSAAERVLAFIPALKTTVKTVAYVKKMDGLRLRQLFYPIADLTTANGIPTSRHHGSGVSICARGDLAVLDWILSGGEPSVRQRSS